MTVLGSTSNTVAFTVADPTPSIGSVIADEPLYAGGQAYVSIYGINLGASAGSVQVCTNATGTCSTASDVSATVTAPYAYWSNTQVNALLTFGSTSANKNYYIQITAAVDASGNSFLETPQDPTGNQSNRGAITPASFAVQVSLSTKLWFFGIGAVTPATFTLGDTKATLTAAGPTGGSFNWQVTAGADKASFSASFSQQSTSTTANNATLYSSAGSTASNDVTIQVTWTDAHGNTFPSASVSTTIDRPYSLASNGPTIYAGAADASCTPGTAGFCTAIPYSMISAENVPIANEYITEAFGPQSFAPGEPNPNDWTPYTQLVGLEGTNYYLSPDGTFSDVIGQAGRVNPRTLPPPTGGPLSLVLVDFGNQAWTVGSEQAAQGVPVQTNIFQRYLDHGAHASIVSPVVQ